MPLDPSIILRSGAEPFDAAGAVQGAYKLKNLLDNSRLAQAKTEGEVFKLEGLRRIADLLPTLADPYGKDAPTVARAMAPYDLEGSVKFLTGTQQRDKAASEAEQARIETGLAQADAISRTVYGIRQLPPEQRQAAYLRSIPMLEQMGLKPPQQWDEGVADQQLALAMSVKEQLEEAGRQRDDARQDRATDDLVRHRGVIEDQSERRIGLTADRNDTLERQGDARLNKPDRVGVVDRVLEKVAAGEPLTEGEVRVLEYSKSGTGRRGGAAGGFRYEGPRTGSAGAEVGGNAISPSAPSLPAAQARTTPPRPNPSAPGRTSGGRFNLPAGYTPQRVVTEARAAIKSGKDPAYIRRQLQSYGINPKVLDR